MPNGKSYDFIFDILSHSIRIETYLHCFLSYPYIPTKRVSPVRRRSPQCTGKRQHTLEEINLHCIFILNDFPCLCS